MPRKKITLGNVTREHLYSTDKYVILFNADLAQRWVPDMIGEFSGPDEVVLARHGMNSTDGELETNLGHPLPRHGNPPVVRTVVNHK